MVLEVAQIDIKPGLEGEFEAGIREAVLLLRRARGFRSFSLRRSVERPSRYRLFVEWDSIENHTDGFQKSPDFVEWRRLLGHCFARPPEVEHMTEVLVPTAASSAT